MCEACLCFELIVQRKDVGAKIEALYIPDSRRWVEENGEILRVNE